MVTRQERMWSSIHKFLNLLFKWFIYFLYIFDGSNYVLKIFKKTFIMGSLCLWLHHRNLLNLTLRKFLKKVTLGHSKIHWLYSNEGLESPNLKNQKSIIVQVHSFPFQFLCHFSEVAWSVIYIILGGVVSKSNTGNNKITSGNNFICPIILL